MKTWPHTALDALSKLKEDYQRLVLFLVSKIENDAECDIEINLDEIGQARIDGDVWDMIQDLLEMKFVIHTDKEEFQAKWLLSASHIKHKGKINIRINRHIQPYLIDLKIKIS